jgi:hypothetical protein
MAVMFTKAELVLIAPEFGDESAERIAAMAELAGAFVNETALGSKAKTGLMLYTAHLLAKGKQAASGASGPVQSERVGDLSTTYATPSAATGGSDFDSTTYGQQYKQLVRSLGLGGFFVQPSY